MLSTVIQNFSYDSARSILTITFVSGSVYHYKNVPRKVYRSLRIASSKGRYFNRSIRDQFEYEHDRSS